MPDSNKVTINSKKLNIKNPHYESRVRQFLERQRFMHLIGFELEVIQPGHTAGTLELRPDHQQQTGLVHGGVTATLADIVAGFAAYTTVPESHHVVTAELSVSYFNPGKGQRLEAKGWVVKTGSMLNFCESEVWCYSKNTDPVLIAKATSVMATVVPQS